MQRLSSALSESEINAILDDYLPVPESLASACAHLDTFNTTERFIIELARLRLAELAAPARG